MAPTAQSSLCVFLPLGTHTRKKFSRKNVIDKTVENINFIKSQLLNTLFFNSLCGKMEVGIKHFFWIPKNMMVVSRKSITHMLEWWAELAAFVTEHHFYLKKWLKGKITLINTWVFGRYFLENKQNKPIISNKEIWHYLLPKIKLSFQILNIRMLKNVYLPL